MIRASSVTFSGVARFLGAASSCRALGVVMPSPKLAKKNEATLAASQGASQDKASAPHIKTKNAEEENGSCRFAGYSAHERPCLPEKKKDGETPTT